MTTFLVILFVVVASSLGLLALNELYRHTNAYRNQFKDILKFKHLATVPDKSVDVIVLGSNAPKFAFDFSEIQGLVCENWAVGPETFEYDFIILKKFCRKLKHGATVIWPVCPGKFFLDKYGDKSVFVKYYGFLDKEEFPDYDRFQFLKDYRYPLIFVPMRLKRLIKDITEDKRIELSHNPMGADNVKKDASWWIHNCWNPEFGIDIEHMAPLSTKNQKAIDFNIGVLRSAIEFCHANGLHVIFAYLPLTKELGSYFSTEYVESQMTRYVKAAIGGQDIPLVDYMKDGRFQDYDLYINSFFMNRKGARAFTNAFVKENFSNQEYYVRQNDASCEKHD